MRIVSSGFLVLHSLLLFMSAGMEMSTGTEKSGINEAAEENGNSEEEWSNISAEELEVPDCDFPDETEADSNAVDDQTQGLQERQRDEMQELESAVRREGSSPVNEDTTTTTAKSEPKLTIAVGSLEEQVSEEPVPVSVGLHQTSTDARGALSASFVSNGEGPSLTEHALDQAQSDGLEKPTLTEHASVDSGSVPVRESSSDGKDGAQEDRGEDGRENQGDVIHENHISGALPTNAHLNAQYLSGQLVVSGSVLRDQESETTDRQSQSQGHPESVSSSSSLDRGTHLDQETHLNEETPASEASVSVTRTAVSNTDREVSDNDRDAQAPALATILDHVQESSGFLEVRESESDVIESDSGAPNSENAVLEKSSVLTEPSVLEKSGVLEKPSVLEKSGVLEKPSTEQGVVDPHTHLGVPAYVSGAQEVKSTEISVPGEPEIHDQSPLNSSPYLATTSNENDGRSCLIMEPASESELSASKPLAPLVRTPSTGTATAYRKTRPRPPKTRPFSKLAVTEDDMGGDFIPWDQNEVVTASEPATKASEHGGQSLAHASESVAKGSESVAKGSELVDSSSGQGAMSGHRSIFADGSAHTDRGESETHQLDNERQLERDRQAEHMNPEIRNNPDAEAPLCGQSDFWTGLSVYGSLLDAPPLVMGREFANMVTFALGGFDGDSDAAQARRDRFGEK